MKVEGSAEMLGLLETLYIIFYDFNQSNVLFLKQKHKTKNFAGFHNHFPLLTMVSSAIQTPGASLKYFTARCVFPDLYLALR